MISEKILHHFWHCFAQSVPNFVSFCNQTVEVLEPGFYNTNQGPDFIFAKIKIGSQTWVGNVEIHVSTSDWNRHNHQQDHNYDNTILHVVWQHDLHKFQQCPVLVLSQFSAVKSFIASSQKKNSIDSDKLIFNKSESKPSDLNFWGFKRLARKATLLTEEVETFDFNWEKAVWGWISRTFGTTVNGLSFYEMAHSFPFWLLKMKCHDQFTLEAIFFGQLGLLNQNLQDKYYSSLLETYTDVRKKFNLNPSVFPVYHLRMRPHSFPSIRLSQLAAFLTQGYFNIQEIQNLKDLSVFENYAKVSASRYWDTHYSFKKETKHSIKYLGHQLSMSILINVYVPYLYAVGQYLDNAYFKDLATTLLRKSEPEDNKIVRYWNSKGLIVNNAFESQALLEFNQFETKND